MEKQTEIKVQQYYLKKTLKELKVSDHFQLLNIDFEIIYHKNGIVVGLDSKQQKTAQFTENDEVLIKSGIQNLNKKKLANV